MTGARLRLFAHFRRRQGPADALAGLNADARDLLEACLLSPVSVFPDGTVRAHHRPLHVYPWKVARDLMADGLLLLSEADDVALTAAGAQLAKLSKRRRRNFTSFWQKWKSA